MTVEQWNAEVPVGTPVRYGDLVETGLPDEPKPPSLSGKTVRVEVDGVSYEAVIR